eukprot:9855936-Alexandrium_andersonii.AAC.1
MPVSALVECSGFSRGLRWSSLGSNGIQFTLRNTMQLTHHAPTPHSKRPELELPSVQNCFRHSKLELCGPRNGL